MHPCEIPTGNSGRETLYPDAGDVPAPDNGGETDNSSSSSAGGAAPWWLLLWAYAVDSPFINLGDTVAEFIVEVIRLSQGNPAV